MRIIPQSTFGWVACGLLVLFIVWAMLLPLILPAGMEISTGLLNFLIVVSSSVAALVAILRNRDHALLVYVCLLPGALVIAYEIVQRLVGD